MLDEARGLLAIFFLEKQLGILRERYIQQMLAGNPPGRDYWEMGESTILRDVKQNFYNRVARLIVIPAEADNVDDEQDFENRSQQLTEQAIIMSHRRLAGIPFVGQLTESDA